MGARKMGKEKDGKIETRSKEPKRDTARKRVMYFRSVERTTGNLKKNREKGRHRKKRG